MAGCRPSTWTWLGTVPKLFDLTVTQSYYAASLRRRGEYCAGSAQAWSRLLGSVSSMRLITCFCRGFSVPPWVVAGGPRCRGSLLGLQADPQAGLDVIEDRLRTEQDPQTSRWQVADKLTFEFPQPGSFSRWRLARRMFDCR